MAVDGTPLLAQLHAAVPVAEPVSTDLGPFVAAPSPALAKLGTALTTRSRRSATPTPLVAHARTLHRPVAAGDAAVRQARGQPPAAWVRRELPQRRLLHRRRRCPLRRDLAHAPLVPGRAAATALCGTYATTPVAGCRRTTAPRYRRTRPGPSAARRTAAASPAGAPAPAAAHGRRRAGPGRPGHRLAAEPAVAADPRGRQPRAGPGSGSRSAACSRLQGRRVAQTGQSLQNLVTTCSNEIPAPSSRRRDLRQPDPGRDGDDPDRPRRRLPVLHRRERAAVRPDLQRQRRCRQRRRAGQERRRADRRRPRRAGADDHAGARRPGMARTRTPGSACRWRRASSRCRPTPATRCAWPRCSAASTSRSSPARSPTGGLPDGGTFTLNTNPKLNHNLPFVDLDTAFAHLRPEDPARAAQRHRRARRRGGRPRHPVQRRDLQHPPADRPAGEPAAAARRPDHALCRSSSAAWPPRPARSRRSRRRSAR